MTWACCPSQAFSCSFRWTFSSLIEFSTLSCWNNLSYQNYVKSLIEHIYWCYHWFDVCTANNLDECENFSISSFITLALCLAKWSKPSKPEKLSLLKRKWQTHQLLSSSCNLIQLRLRWTAALGSENERKKKLWEQIPELGTLPLYLVINELKNHPAATE